MALHTLHSWETRRYRVVVSTDTDPTGDTVEFGVAADDADPTVWTAGSWIGSFDATADEAVAQSPTFGTTESTPSADVDLTEGSTYKLYCRVRNASDGPGALVAMLRAT